MRRKKILAGIFIASWVILLAWSFQGFRTWVRFSIISLLGFGTREGSMSFPEEIPLGDFYPETVLRQERHIPEKPMVPTFEFHGHIFTESPDSINKGLEEVHDSYFVDLAVRTTNAKDLVELRKKYNNPKILFFPGVDWSVAGETDDFGPIIAKTVEEMAKTGIKGLKLWKNFGLHQRTKDGNLLRMDDKRLDPVWDVCAKYRLIVAMHTADPPAFFHAIDGKNERFGELGHHPEWSFYGEDFPSFEEILQQRDNLFKHRKDVIFVGLHFGELAHDLEKAAQLLDENPNVYLDTAQRIDELGRQPRASREFFIKYQDRILYGTDGPPDYEKNRIYWRFFETADEYFDYYPPHKPRKGIWKISGLNLPKDVIRKLYSENAKKLLRIQ